MEIIQRKSPFFRAAAQSDKMRFVFSSCLVILMISLTALIPGALHAEFRCQADVSYVWKKTPPVLEEGEKQQMSDEQEEPKRLVFSQPFSEAETEEKARAKLESLVLRERGKAREACRREHENVSHCIGSKLESMRGVLDRSGFSVRQRLEESIQTDCEQKRGLCQKTEVSEYVCEETAAAAAEEGEEGEEEDEKKGRR